MRILLYLACVVFLAVPAIADAQPFEPREDEAAFSAAAMKHAEAGDFDAAIAEAEKAVAVRGLNVFWLNLGRFQQRAKRCSDALSSYTSAMTAPPVTKPDAELVRKTAQKYVSELATECPAQVTVRCTPPDMTVVVSQEDQTSSPIPVACGQQFSLAGGTWRFVGTYGTETVEATQELRIAREYDVPLVIDVPVADSADVTPPNNELHVETPSASTSKGVKPAPLLLFIGASLVAATGLVLDVGLPTSQNGELDGMDFVPVALYLGSIGMIVAGAVLW